MMKKTKPKMFFPAVIEDNTHYYSLPLSIELSVGTGKVRTASDIRYSNIATQIHKLVTIQLFWLPSHFKYLSLFFM